MLSLEVLVNGETLEPRQPFSSVAYAFQSQESQTAADADTLDGLDASALEPEEELSRYSTFLSFDLDRHDRLRPRMARALHGVDPDAAHRDPLAGGHASILAECRPGNKHGSGQHRAGLVRLGRRCDSVCVAFRAGPALARNL